MTHYSLDETPSILSVTQEVTFWYLSSLNELNTLDTLSALHHAKMGLLLGTLNECAATNDIKRIRQLIGCMKSEMENIEYGEKIRDFPQGWIDLFQCVELAINKTKYKDYPKDWELMKGSRLYW